MLYIHDSVCISPQRTFGNIELDELVLSANGKLMAIEPPYPGVPPNILRRMGKAVRMGVGSAMPMLADNNFLPSGIIIGTALGGMEDCIKFLNQIIEYNEGQLTPTNFVQSTSNAIAGQIGLLSRNKSYNITHVHRGHAFENALLDAMMLVEEHPGAEFLVGGIDEISSYNYNIDLLAGWFKKESITNRALYDTHTEGTLAGEGATMYRVNARSEGAKAGVQELFFFQSEDMSVVTQQIKSFLDKQNLIADPVDLIISGENGDNRLDAFYQGFENLFPELPPVVRFKHMTGEYHTAIAAGLWTACELLSGHTIPTHAIRQQAPTGSIDRILLYNTFRGVQHSVILITR